ncbi:MAG: hypothetical protein L0H64_04175 [Pseudonocardia sp.]|nr:hypothetical protein [Pseudonocardia sp.]
MTLRIVYRSYGGDNEKDRPAYYGKLLALRSLLRAADAVGCEIVFLNDGPVSETVLDLMRGRGEIVELPGLGLFGSRMTALRLPLERGWADDDVVYFCEDDYLHTADALVHLKAATERLAADYFALYGTLPAERTAGRVSDPSHVQPRGWRPGEARVGDQEWVRVLGTTSTFGVRVAALRADLSFVRQARIPHRNMYRDWDVSLAYQGFEPYCWAGLLRDLVLRTPAGSLGGRVRSAVLAPFKMGMNLRSHRRARHRRVLMAASPNLATHLETEFLATGRDWEQVARETREWAQVR